MKHYLWILSSVFILNGQLSSASAESYSSNRGSIELKENCLPFKKSRNELTDSEMLTTINCMAYILGLLDMYLLLDAATKYGYFCMPSQLHAKQVALMYLKYLDDNPEVLHHPPTVILLRMLGESFPCSQNKK